MSSASSSTPGSARSLRSNPPPFHPHPRAVVRVELSFSLSLSVYICTVLACGECGGGRAAGGQGGQVVDSPQGRSPRRPRP
eukprot:832718-Rhodomonas_salina.1